MKNFPVEYNGKTYWIARSSASVIFIFCKDANGHWCIAANKRGQGCPDYQGCWVCPCGYLDYDETTKEAAIRETKEEIGLTLNPNNVYFASVNSSPKMNLQNVTFKYFTVLDGTTDMYHFNTDNMEENEVTDVRWIRLDYIFGKFENVRTVFENADYAPDRWAFNHYYVINEIFETYVNIPFWKKWVFKLYNKWFCQTKY